MNPYEEITDQPNATREDYLHYLHLTYGVEYQTVLMFADLLGPEEDFDGLVTELEDLR